jgi:hypothetical protein
LKKSKKSKKMVEIVVSGLGKQDSRDSTNEKLGNNGK